MVKNKWGIEIIPKKICAIDASTNSLAFAMFDTFTQEIISVGKIFLKVKILMKKLWMQVKR